MSKKKRLTVTEPGLEVLKLLPIPKTPEQEILIKSIEENQITLVSGPAGTGKTFLATCYGISNLLLGKFDKIVFTRPCIEANGERLGFLPGSAAEKLSVYLLPILDILEQKLEAEVLSKLFSSGTIKTIPLAFLRGVTFHNTFVLADEAQNTTPEQIRLLLTRIGKKSKIVVTGDTRQSDIYTINGLADGIRRLTNINSIGIVNMTEQSIVRNEIIRDIEARYIEN